MWGEGGGFLISASTWPASYPGHFIPRESSQHPRTLGKHPAVLVLWGGSNPYQNQKVPRHQACSQLTITTEQLRFPASTLDSRNRCSSHSILKFLSHIMNSNTSLPIIWLSTNWSFSSFGTDSMGHLKYRKKTFMIENMERVF